MEKQRQKQQQNSPVEPSKIHFNLKAFSASLLSLLTGHLQAFFTDLDGTKDCYSEAQLTELSTQPIKNNPHYAVPLIIMLFNMADTVFILSKEQFHYNSTGMVDLFTHRIYLPEFWYTGTVILHIVIAMNIVVYALLIFKPMLDAKHTIFICHEKGDQAKVVQNGRVWKQANAEQFLKYRKSRRSLVRFTQVTVYTTAVPYWFFGLVVNYRGEFRDYLYFLYLPVFCLYSAFGVVFISFYIMLVANYMRVQQNFLLEKIEALTETIRRTKTNNKSRRLSAATIWRRFTAINSEIFNFFEQLKAVSQFWSPLLSIYFVGHIGMEIYLIYGFIIEDKENFDWFRRSYFLYFTVEFMILLIAITAACSTVVRHNVEIYKTNVAFCYAFTKNYNVGLFCRFKMDKMIANYKGTRNGFRLVTNYVVDSKMFEAIAFYISTVFMKLIR